jgi:hypothetical protein
VRYDELALWALLNSGVAATDPAARRLIEKIVLSPLTSTYLAALQAMILEQVDGVGYRWRIAQCAQYLVDGQCESGEWAYGESVLYAREIPLEAVKERRSAEIRKQRRGPARGDLSNSQFAALGLRACRDAGLAVDKEVLQRALGAWEESQRPDGAWCYVGRERDHEGYGSMTAAGLSSVAILHALLKTDVRKIASVERALQWLGRKFSASEHPGKKEHYEADTPTWHQYYYLYAVATAGLLTRAQRFGTRAWHAEGVEVLLRLQREDGSWPPAYKYANPVIDTSFALLFLQRACRPLSVEPRRR